MISGAAMAIVCTLSARASAQGAVECWPRDVPLVAPVVDPPTGPCAFPSTELAEVSSWTLDARARSVLDAMRRELRARGYRVSRTSRTAEGLSLEAERGGAAGPFRRLLLVVRPDRDRSRLTIYDWDHE
jgi:hypothetical protein